MKKDAVYTCTSDAHVPKNAKPTTPYFTDNYWKHPENQAIQIFDPDVEFGVPFAPTPFRVTFHIKAGDVEVTREVPVEFRYVKDIYLGDKRMELNVVPAFSVSVTPALAVIPASGGAVDAGQARDPRHGDQRREGRGRGHGVSRSARRMEGDSRQRAAQLRA